MQDKSRGRRWVGLLAGGVLALSSLGAGGASYAAPLPAKPGADKIDAQVMNELADGGRTEFWVRLVERADLTQASKITDWNKRGQAVYDALTSTAASSQKELRAELDAADVSYEAFWVTNSIRINGGDAELVAKLAASADVEGVYPTMQIEIPDLEAAPTEKAPNAIEWGINDINAPDVWDSGYTGEGLIVASIDTGVQWDHPALIQQYRGYDAATGEADHNYNWFDYAGTRPAPVDGNGHGTHVTGTMVGTDGGDNQIGVAPGAKWIAANGCCPSDAALIASGQWTLAPTDLNGQNPDVSKRPHIINNSWGTTTPSNDPFMEDISEAWAAAGQFGVFANGNNGPNCQTSGSPGSRTINYSVGNYNSSHTISASSSKGAGQDGVIKPNIAAPGSAVRSSVPGNGYASYSGTSMASPHVAGAVALLWSASDDLVGDVDATRAVLNGTAIDTENLQCGGTAENNNVFGEGRLDAKAALDIAPIGPSGTIAGVVSDATSNAPIAGAKVTVAGPSERTLTANSEGEFSARVAVGDYSVTGAAFGYLSKTVDATVNEDQTTTVNLDLTPAESAVVTGTVTDGSGFGFPLYAKVAVSGTSVFTYTDPESGEYSMSLPVGASYTVRVEVQYPGYETVTREIEVNGAVTEDIAVPVDAQTCTAPGYHVETTGLTESFDSAELPAGWTIEDYAGNGQTWGFTDPRNRGNLTGGEGGFAMVDSDNFGSGNTQDTSLVTPSVDFSDVQTPAVGFKMDFRRTNDIGAVRVSVDGGAWQKVAEWTASARGPREEIVHLPMAAGSSDVKIDLHYTARWGYWWQIDDVFIGERSCVPATDGGYVVGNVRGSDTDEGIVGATVVNLDDEEQKGMTVATPADPNLDDGFYWIFSDTPGTHPFQASARQHASQTQDVTVQHADAVRADFSLGSGFVVVDPTSVQHTVELGKSQSSNLVFTNTGSATAAVELLEVPGGFEILRVDRTSDRERQGAPVVRNKAETSLTAAGAPGTSLGASTTAAPNDTWVPMADLPRAAMDNRMVNLDDDYYSIGGTTGSAAFPDVYKFGADSQTWTQVAPLPEAASATAAAVVDGKIVVSGGWITGGVSRSTYVYDPDADTWTKGADAPAAVSAAGVTVFDGLMYVVGGCTTSDCLPMSKTTMAYDVAADSWQTVGDYPLAAAFSACGAIDTGVLCSGGNPGTGGVKSSYLYDPGSDSWSPAADAPVDHWAANYATANGLVVISAGVQGGDITNDTFAFDSTVGDWVTDVPNPSTAVYRGGMSCGLGKAGGSTSGFSPVATAEQLPGWDCPTAGGQDVPWLILDPTTFTVDPGASVTVKVTTDSSVVDQPGTYTAGIRVSTDTPQKLDVIPVTMIVTAPKKWGVLRGTVSGKAADGSVSPIHGAMVDLTPQRAGQPSPVLWTDADGKYAVWLPSMQGGKYAMIVTADGFRPQTRQTQISTNRPRIENFILEPVVRK